MGMRCESSGNIFARADSPRMFVSSSLLSALGFFLPVISIIPVVFAACTFNPHGLKAEDRDSGVSDGATDALILDVVTEDGSHEDRATLCEEGEFRCENELRSASICRDGKWFSLGYCFLGCEEASSSCRVPSNVDPEILGFEESSLGHLDLPAGVEVEIDTSTGMVLNTTDASVLRGEGEGSVVDGIGFYRRSQPGDAPSLGVFILKDLFVPEDTQVVVVGSGALVILAAGHVTFLGSLDGGAWGARGGAGGFDGGRIGLPGEGPCPGYTGQFHPICPDGCASGSGGGGFGGFGGSGGPVDCTVQGGTGVHVAGGFGGGSGDDKCGTPELIPLLGGSGGGAGVPLYGQGGSEPGLGGGGGGAVQISARASLFLGEQCVITTPGGGGRQTFSGGGSGGGAGGGILLESGSLFFSTTSLLSANGGGGGAGDCMIDSNDVGQGGERGKNGDLQAMGGDNTSNLAGGIGGGGAYSGEVSGEVGGSRCLPDQGSNGGGGGGGGGRIRLNIGGEPFIPPAAVFSPQPDTSGFSMGPIKTKPLFSP